MSRKGRVKGVPTSMVFPTEMMTRLKRESTRLGLPLVVYVKSIIQQFFNMEDKRGKRTPKPTEEA